MADDDLEPPDDLPVLFATQDEGSILARLRAGANAGLSPTDDVDEWTETREGSHWHRHVVGGVQEQARWYDEAGRTMLQAMFPQTAWGEYLDRHAETRGVQRLQGVRATGSVVFAGTPGTVVQAGARVGAPPPTPGALAPVFETLAAATVGADVAVRAVDAGVSGVVPAGAITQILSPMPNVASVTNAAATQGGTNRESDVALRRRTMATFRRGVANGAYYRGVALAVAGVGRARVIPNADGPGTVLIVVSTEGGDPVSAEALAEVRRVLAPPGQDPGTGQGQTGATITVESSASFLVDVAATVELLPGYSLDGDASTTAVRAAILAAIASVVDDPTLRDEIVRARVIGRVVAVEGVHDVSLLTLNGQQQNLAIPTDPPGAANLDDVTLTATAA